MDEQRVRYKAYIDRLCLMDDTFFNVCMDGYIAGMACILRIILALPELIVERVTVQETTENLYGRGVRFDAFVRAGKRRMNVEVQRDERGAQPERARFNSSMMDARELQKRRGRQRTARNVCDFHYGKRCIRQRTAYLSCETND